MYARLLSPPKTEPIVPSTVAEGTVLPPVNGYQKNQLLLSVQSNDFRFVAERNLNNIYNYLPNTALKPTTQTAAISFSACID
ncbi:MAG: hypothetical protein IPN94_12020 [Sphingobacteriales bacterium]|nr:hypothetical protein [Sphingobacteriales bacterium]